jgi:hypothetical protein
VVGLDPENPRNQRLKLVAEDLLDWDAISHNARLDACKILTATKQIRKDIRKLGWPAGRPKPQFKRLKPFNLRCDAYYDW